MQALTKHIQQIHNFPITTWIWHEYEYTQMIHKCAASWENQQSAYAKTKTQISFAVTATGIVTLIYFLNPKFQASGHLLWRYRPVCVGPVKNHIVGFVMMWLKLRMSWYGLHKSWMMCKLVWVFAGWIHGFYNVEELFFFSEELEGTSYTGTHQ